MVSKKRSRDEQPESSRALVVSQKWSWGTLILFFRIARYFCNVISRKAEVDMILQAVLPQLIPVIRTMITVEVDRRMFRPFNKTPRMALEGDMSRRYKLSFSAEFKDKIYAKTNIKGKKDVAIKIAMHDASHLVVKSKPFSCAKITIVALQADFCADGRETWTKEEFKNAIVSDKGNLLDGNLELKLDNGEGLINVKFTDISRWAKGQKFRLGVTVSEDLGQRVLEAISTPFQVLHGRGKGNAKPDVPLLNDKVEKLKGIGLDGPIRKRLEEEGIDNVEKLLQSFYKDEDHTKQILGLTAKKTIDHAKMCDPGTGLYSYQIGNRNLTLFFNAVYAFVGASFGDTYISINELNPFQKDLVDAWKGSFYKNANNLQFDYDMVDGQPISLQAYTAPIFRGSNSFQPGPVHLHVPNEQDFVGVASGMRFNTTQGTCSTSGEMLEHNPHPHTNNNITYRIGRNDAAKNASGATFYQGSSSSQSNPFNDQNINQEIWNSTGAILGSFNSAEEAFRIDSYPGTFHENSTIVEHPLTEARQLSDGLGTWELGYSPGTDFVTSLLEDQ